MNQGDGSCGPVPDGRKSNLWVDGRRFKVRHADAYVDRPGDHGTPGLVAGTLEFYLDSEAMPCASGFVLEPSSCCRRRRLSDWSPRAPFQVKTGNQYSLEYAGDYQPMLRAQLRCWGCGCVFCPRFSTIFQPRLFSLRATLSSTAICLVGCSLVSRHSSAISE